MMQRLFSQGGPLFPTKPFSLLGILRLSCVTGARAVRGSTTSGLGMSAIRPTPRAYPNPRAVGATPGESRSTRRSARRRGPVVHAMTGEGDYRPPGQRFQTLLAGPAAAICFADTFGKPV